MMPSEELEDVIRNIRPTTSAAADERIMTAVRTAMEERQKQRSASAGAVGAVRRTIMSNNWTKLATAAAIVIAAALGMYALTGSIDGASITLAQVRQAMQNVDWMKIINAGGDENQNPHAPEVDWFSFGSRVHITVIEGRIRYRDFKTGKTLRWSPGDANIIETTIDPSEQFAYGAAGPFEMIDKTLRLNQAEHDAEVSRTIGTHEGRKVQVWKAVWNAAKQPGVSRTLTVYIDSEKRLPIAATFEHGRPDGKVTESNIEFEYPETGPSNIYEAGVPQSAQIKPSFE